VPSQTFHGVHTQRAQAPVHTALRFISASHGSWGHAHGALQRSAPGLVNGHLVEPGFQPCGQGKEVQLAQTALGIAHALQGLGALCMAQLRQHQGRLGVAGFSCYSCALACHCRLRLYWVSTPARALNSASRKSMADTTSPRRALPCSKPRRFQPSMGRAKPRPRLARGVAQKLAPLAAAAVQAGQQTESGSGWTGRS